MLATLTKLKTRLGIADTDITRDDLLTSILEAISTRFDQECNRTFARTENTTYEFDPSDTEIIPPLYPIESVSKFELKQSESEGWVEQTDVEFLIRRACVVSLGSPLSTINNPLSTARVTYTGGYVLPGDTPGAGQTALPIDLEQAAVEQVAYWFRNRNKTGLSRSWPHDGTFEVFLQSDLLPEVRAVLKKYERLLL